MRLQIFSARYPAVCHRSCFPIFLFAFFVSPVMADEPVSKPVVTFSLSREQLIPGDVFLVNLKITNGTKNQFSIPEFALDNWLGMAIGGDVEIVPSQVASELACRFPDDVNKAIVPGETTSVTVLVTTIPVFTTGDVHLEECDLDLYVRLKRVDRDAGANDANAEVLILGERKRVSFAGFLARDHDRKDALLTEIHGDTFLAGGRRKGNFKGQAQTGILSLESIDGRGTHEKRWRELLEAELNETSTLVRLHQVIQQAGVCCVDEFDVRRLGEFVESSIASSSPVERDWIRPKLIEEIRRNLTAKQKTQLYVHYQKTLDPKLLLFKN
ncbi:hypothetical protein SH528x_006260 [Novipirellula sp. SH528]|uniref:hypothetical protein n=1 Tax=Novipirellula sp. SH528 TaxID=3454466 RepID=UPI003F9F2215